MFGTSRASIARSALLTGTMLAVATIAAPASADPIDVMTSVHVVNIAQPTTPAEQKVVQFRIAKAAEAACGTDSRSLPEYRYATRRSQCFQDSYASAMAQLTSRWGGGAAGR